MRKFWKITLRWTLFFFIIYFVIIFYLHNRIDVPSTRRFLPHNLSYYKCPSDITNELAHYKNVVTENEQHKQLDKRILLVTKRDGNKLVSGFLSYLKVPIRIVSADQVDKFELEFNQRGRLSLIVFEDYRYYYNLNNNKKQQLHEYCAKYSIGIISFLLGSGDAEYFHFSVENVNTVKSLQFSDSIVNHVVRPLTKFQLNPYLTDCTAFSSSNATTILSAYDATQSKYSVEIFIKEKSNAPHIIFGCGLYHWMLQLAFFDAVVYMAPHIAGRELERFIQIDIDDVFLGETGEKLSPSDVDYLLETQADLRKYITDFTFLLGFSGDVFRYGNALDSAGDERLIEVRHNFLWFPHMWHHNHAHEFTTDYLQVIMTQNKMFAMNMNLNMNAGYAISPQHNGVYPIHEALFDSWRQIWNVSVTSTEEYPHFSPASDRRGFIYKNISVIPRQVSGLFTHTLFMHAYPNGIDSLYANVFGGTIFETVLMNQFSIFMTHQQNYASDRLGAFTFRNLVRFISCWTNLKLKWEPPAITAQKYFKKFSDEKQLIYTNPCTDPRHRVMLSLNSTLCNNLTLPTLIILGPQKTGTSALSSFLLLHPDVSTNAHIPKYYEELQFFNGANYNLGLSWYAEKFSQRNNSSFVNNHVIFEKSANYFDNVDAPRRIKALLPSATLVVILMDPIDRAYSWYQHMRSHNDTAATNFSAEEVFMGNNVAAEGLRSRCLTPGMYNLYLDRWLDYFRPHQLILIDGDHLKNKPAVVMRSLTERLGLSDSVDFSARLKFVSQKGFFCPVFLKNNGQIDVVKCLGRSKGRRYPAMTTKLRRFLSAFYEPYNQSLKNLLITYNFSMPTFLANI